MRDLEPNTKYEFAVRLHLDQLSSPWSPVVYQNTFPKGENAETSYSPINFFMHKDEHPHVKAVLSSLCLFILTSQLPRNLLPTSK